MPTYILLLTLTPEGRQKTLEEPESLLRAENATRIEGIQVLGLYGVLGSYDFVSIVEAPDNDAVAEFSLELGVKAGVHIATLPAIPISRLDRASSNDARQLEMGAPGPGQGAGPEQPPPVGT